MDLMIPMRLLNLPHGCTLTLVQSTDSQTSSAPVNVKLQVSGDDKPYILSIDGSSSVRQMLQAFETKFSIILSQRSSTVEEHVIGAVKTLKVDYLPILQIFSTVIPGSDPQMEKSLLSLGIGPGNVVIRVSFQEFNRTVVSQREVVEATPVEQEQVLLNERDELNDMVDHEILAQKEAVFEKPVPKTNNNDDSVMATYGDEDRAEISTLRLFDPLLDSITPITEDEKSYDMSIDQAKLYHKLVTMSGLNDRTRLKLNASKKPVDVKYVSVRIKLPNLSILELNFDKNDELALIYDTLRSRYLVKPDLEFQLFQNYPHKLIEPSNELILELLGPKTVLQLQTSSRQQILKQDIHLENLSYSVSTKEEDIEEVVPAPNPTPIAPNPVLVESRSDTKKVPKWLKLAKK